MKWRPAKAHDSSQITPWRLMELINDPDKAKAKRAMEAMINMVKIDIATIERAAAKE